MNTPLIQAYCKLACFQTIVANKYNICKCTPYCKLLNNTLSKNTSAYIQGPDAKEKDNKCVCNQVCKHTQCTLDTNKFKHIDANYES